MNGQQSPHASGRQGSPRPSRRQVIKGAAVVGTATAVLVGGGVVGWQALTDRPSGPTTTVREGQAPSLEALADSAVSAGPGRDGIPSIDEPEFVPAAEAGFLSDDEPVFGLVHDGEVKAYPQQVLVWHEIVNDTVGGDPLAVTYCPLTGTVIGLSAPDGVQDLTFGTTGKLVNSNLYMYDRETGSQWPQLTGQAVTGPLKGTQLDAVPLVWTTWEQWRTEHPDTEVLSTDTGALRSYGTDPYGSYDDYPERGGYYASGRPVFPVLASSDRFGHKDVVVGVRVGEERLAIDKQLVRANGTVRADLGGTPVEARWDEELGTARVFQRAGDRWVEADFLDAMWFSWYAFYPDTRVRA
ncbi:DUF3179 domain-containing protein [Streptomyces sp. JJ38]|uniref:DUF3179 domain-containing protein n=1 Tax=Streptomyces sp. JJ38 TaxID=2738128 RepID=UPI001C5767F6|nr:DUF3179 domain-containing protein [Streptomyces sp. JJ38]MBW1597444.1 DUF3179 domain-containing protein [Streptomyces sp. JJ38]